MSSQEIRRQFLEFFKKKGHVIVPSSSVVPHEDPTLLFINAGMNQFKDIFLGESTRDYTRAVSSQKCIRVGGKHNDLDNVGHTKRHLTFFEMLGNFSFGDYFKKEAIALAWELSTEVFQFDPERLWITVYKKDDEAFELWKSHVKEDRILCFGEKDNFWSMGDIGPCGPCSELFYDRGPKYGSLDRPSETEDDERFLEFWNLVFMQYNRSADGKMTPLKKQSIDTGSGLERVMSLKMDVDSVFQTDVLQHIIHKISAISGRKYEESDLTSAPAFHVIADHLRSLSFAIADGAQPSNVERGYVLRKILRRAVRYGRALGMDRPFMAQVLPSLVEMMGDDFPEIKTLQTRIGDLLTIEEESFLRTLKRGGNILNTIIDQAQTTKRQEITGEDAFKLKDTYGFPIEEIVLIAKDANLKVNLDAYEILEEQAKERSRGAQATVEQEMKETLFTDFATKHGTSSFTGYDRLEDKGSIIALIANGEFVDELNGEQKAMIVLDNTPFYAEKGGQVGDHGLLEHDGAKFQVANTTSPAPDVIVHHGTLKEGTLLLGEPLMAKVNAKRRSGIARHHTATHLLHYALVQVCGEHIRQGGSLVEEDRLRFDFSHHKPLTHDEIREIERIVNCKIRLDTPLETSVISYEEAQKHQEIKQFFGEKYGTKVRVVDIGGYSKELCGGTHVDHLGSIGYFRITKESSIAKGVRRIEASAGKIAENFAYESEDRLLKIAEEFDTPVQKLEERLEQIQGELSRLKVFEKRELQKALHSQVDHLVKSAKTVGKTPLILGEVDVDLIELGNLLSTQWKSGVIFLAMRKEDRCQILLKISEDFVEKGLHANAMIKDLAPLIKGGGGGKKDAAQAGGKDPRGIPDAFKKLEEILSAL